MDNARRIGGEAADRAGAAVEKGMGVAADKAREFGQWAGKDNGKNLLPATTMVGAATGTAVGSLFGLVGEHFRNDPEGTKKSIKDYLKSTVKGGAVGAVTGGAAGFTGGLLGGAVGDRIGSERTDAAWRSATAADVDPRLIREQAPGPGEIQTFSPDDVKNPILVEAGRQQEFNDNMNRLDQFHNEFRNIKGSTRNEALAMGAIVGGAAGSVISLVGQHFRKDPEGTKKNVKDYLFSMLKGGALGAGTGALAVAATEPSVRTEGHSAGMKTELEYQNARDARVKGAENLDRLSADTNRLVREIRTATKDNTPVHDEWIADRASRGQAVPKAEYEAVSKALEDPNTYKALREDNWVPGSKTNTDPGVIDTAMANPEMPANVGKGAAIGAASGGLLGTIALHFKDNPEGTKRKLKDYFKAAALGGGSGAVIGAGTGFAVSGAQ